MDRSEIRGQDINDFRGPGFRFAHPRYEDAAHAPAAVQILDSIFKQPKQFQVREFQICVRALAARCARGFPKTVRPAKQRAQGMPGAHCTHSLACNVKWHTSVVTTGTPEITRHSPRNGFTAYTALSPATNSSCHRHPRIKALPKARSGRLTSANLTPATGARTTRLHRTQQHRSSARRSIAHGSGSIQNPPCNSLARLMLPRPPHPIPTFVTMANAPSLGTGWRES